MKKARPARTTEKVIDQFSPTELADLCGVGYHHIWQVRTGRRVPSAMLASKIARHAGLSVDDIMHFARWKMGQAIRNGVNGVAVNKRDERLMELKKEHGGQQ